MKLDIIQYNKYNLIRKILIGVIVTFFVASALIGIRSINPIIIYCIVSLFALSSIIIVLIPNYSKIGSITLQKPHQCIIKHGNNTELLKIEKMLFRYGGYAGAEYPLWYLPALFTKSRDGTQNYIIINNLEFQVYLSCKKEYIEISSFVDEMRISGINSKWITMTYKEILGIPKIF